MATVELDLRSPGVLIAVGVLAVVLFLASYVVEVRIVFVRPNYGDVTATVHLIWRAVLGLTTVGSFALGLYDLLSDDAGVADGPATKIEIEGSRHDIDVYPDRTSRDPDGAETADESDPTSTSEESDDPPDESDSTSGGTGAAGQTERREEG